MQIIDDKALLLQVRNPDRIVEIIPRSEIIERGDELSEVVVYWGLEEARVLQALKIPGMPSPIVAKYDWPGRYKPFAHQIETASFFTLNPRCFCFNEQGTGKTGAALWAADYLMNLGKIRRVLVICPLSIMQSAWLGDCFNFVTHRRAAVCYGPAERRREIINSDAEIVIINYDGVEIVRDEIAAGGFDLMVVDECFAKGTPVLTPHGDVPIESIRPGDSVLTSAGAKQVVATTSKPTKRLVRVHLSNGQTLDCTPEHPFFTDLGWVTAAGSAGRRLVAAHDLPNVQRSILDAQGTVRLAPLEGYEYGADLLAILRTEEIPHTAPRSELFQTHARAPAREFKGGSPHAGTASANFAAIEGGQAQAPHTGRERNGDDPVRGVGVHCLTGQLDLELPNSVGPEAARLSYELQSRFWQPADEASVGGRRGQPLFGGAQSTGHQEDREAQGTWVVGISHIECPSEVPVYNLQVAGAPNYFVGRGYLVHNCNAYKNSATNRWKTLATLIKAETWLWLMTGTPAAQSPVDAYGLARLVNPKAVPRFAGRWKEMVMKRVSQFTWIPRENAKELVHQVLQPAIRFTKADCLDLPEMTYVTREVPLTPQQKRYYDLMKKKLVVSAAGESITMVNAASAMTKLLQLSGGTVYSDSGEVISFDASVRINVLMEVIEEAAAKVLVFVPFRHAIEVVSEELVKAGYTTEVIHGDVSAGKRTEIFKRFQSAQDPRVLVIQPQAASHGVTLHAADTIVYWSPVMSVETYLQANARAHRAGQRNPVTIVHLTGSDIERRVYRMLQDKMDIHSKIVDLYHASV